MRALGHARAEETQRAAAVLGILSNHTLLVGSPGVGLFRLFTPHFSSPYTLPRTGAVYVRGAVTPGAPFMGEALEAGLAAGA